MNSKTAIYIRVSTQWQTDKDSLQVQRRDLIAYSELVLGITDCEVFEDAGYSAKNTDRPDYQKMMGRIRSGEFSHLLVWKIDRISRNLLDFSEMYTELKSLGVTFVSKNEQFDTSTAIGEAMLKIILVFAELERKMTAERVTAVMLSRANNGQWNGGRVPFGYSYDKTTKEISIDPNESEVVKKVFQSYLREQSLLATCKYLNDSGIRTRKGFEFTPSTVNHILRNEFYLGTYIYNRYAESGTHVEKDPSEWIRVENHHEPIIDRQTFSRANAISIDNHRGSTERGRSFYRKHIHIFSGLLTCGVCGCQMVATVSRKSKRVDALSVYGCSGRRRNSDCTNSYTNDLIIGQFVFNFLSNILRATDNSGPRTHLDTLESKLLRGPIFADVDHIEQEGLTQLRKSLYSNQGYPLPSLSTIKSNATLESLQTQRRKEELALSRLKTLYLYSESETSEKDYIIEKNRIIDRLNAIDAQISKLDLPNENITEAASYYIMAKELTANRYFDYEQYIQGTDHTIPRNFLRSIIRNITVTNGRVMSIVFRNSTTIKFIYRA